MVFWYSHVLKNFPHFVVIHIVKGFGIVSKVDIFLELSCFFNDPSRCWQFDLRFQAMPGERQKPVVPGSKGLWLPSHLLQDGWQLD